MTFPKARLVVSLCLFLGWLGFLGYLVSQRNAVKLSRPQFAIADAVVFVSVKDNDPNVVVKEVAWHADAVGGKAILGQISLPELLSLGKDQGFHGAGDYVIPLIRRGDALQVAPVQTPGYRRQASHATLFLKSAGDHPEMVLQRFIRFTTESPSPPAGVLESLRIPIIECVFARIWFPQMEPRVRIQNVEIPGLLGLGDAEALQHELADLGADVRLREVELRVYPLNAQTRAQLDEILETSTEPRTK